uniref:AtPDCT1/2 transmembrane domain-containing protein n=1 Tax=Salix viminalis TaxID=40686 RepID=A0A6N2M969_SALVM
MKTTSTTTSATITATIPTPFKRKQINSGVNMEEKEKKINGIVTDGVSNRFYAAEPFFLKWTVRDMVNLAKHHWLPCFFGFGLLFFMAVEYTLFMVPASSPPFDLGFIATRRLHGLLSSWPELNTVLAALNTEFLGSGADFPVGNVSFFLFYSGHVAGSVIASLDMRRMQRWELAWTFDALNVLQVIRLLGTRGHYTIDLVVGVGAGILFDSLAGKYQEFKRRKSISAKEALFS